MDYKEFRKALESLTVEERYLLNEDLEDSFGMTNEGESDIELPIDFGMTRED